MENDIREKIERWTIKAEGFLKTNTKAFIIDTNDTWYFCDVVFVDGECVHVKNFKGPRKYETERIFWADVVRFEEYREEVKE